MLIKPNSQDALDDRPPLCDNEKELPLLRVKQTVYGNNSSSSIEKVDAVSKIVVDLNGSIQSGKMEDKRISTQISFRDPPIIKKKSVVSAALANTEERFFTKQKDK